MSLLAVVINLLVSLLYVANVHAKCECGYVIKNEGTFTDAFEADFFHQGNIGNDANWDVSDYTETNYPFNMKYEKENVISNPMPASSGDPGLQLLVRGPTPSGSPVRTAELATKRTDMFYGSYRAAIKYTSVSGTCGSMFWRKDDTHEIDFELLSSQDSASSSTNRINLVLHSTGPSGFETPSVPFHLSDGFHEYRFDWSPGRVSYYVDGEHMKDLTEGVPDIPGPLVFNHWSNGDEHWTYGPPTKDAYMTIGYVKTYFNTSQASQKNDQCVDPGAKDAVCEVPEQRGPVTPGQDTTFLATNGQIAQPTSVPTPSKPSSTPGNDKVSPDATCGGEKGYTCMGSAKGNCCSQHGWW
ncbi:MAG: hypothetical protein LQ352_001835 [Teloschistes flavicans]|nr:MAG: hypothetical protein LQ352_001835 [Teloschistes flavicans]